MSGYAGSGKDTVAAHLIENHAYVRFAFADVLKDMVAEQYNIDVKMLHTPELKEAALSQYPVFTADKFGEMIHSFMQKEFKKDDNGVLCWTPRALAILEGSVKRSVNSSYWVGRVVQKIKESSKNNPDASFVISDLRYKSEVKQLEAAFGDTLDIVRVERFKDSPSNDPSERDLDDYEFKNILNNTGTLEELYEKTQAFA